MLVKKNKKTDHKSINTIFKHVQFPYPITKRETGDIKTFSHFLHSNVSVYHIIING